MTIDISCDTMQCTVVGCPVTTIKSVLMVITFSFFDKLSSLGGLQKQQNLA